MLGRLLLKRMIPMLWFAEEDTITGEDLLKSSKKTQAPEEEKDKKEEAPAEPKPEEKPEEKPPVEEPAEKKPDEDKEKEPPSEDEIDKKVDAFLQSLKQKQNKPEPPKEKTLEEAKTPDPDEVEFKDYKTLVSEGRIDEAMEVFYQEKVKEAQAKQFTDTQVQQWHDTRYQANKDVYKKYPELMEVDAGKLDRKESKIAQAIGDIYQTYPNLLEIPEGPRLAMELAEKKAGIKKSDSSAASRAREEGAAGEAERQDATRASAALATSGGAAPIADVGSYEPLNESEKIVASRMGMTEAEYAKSKGRKPVFNNAYYSKYRNAHNRPRSAGGGA